MQHVVTGLGPDGRSTVLERRDLSSPPGERVVVETVWSTQQLPPGVPQPLHTQGEPADIGVPQVGSSWLIVKWPPGADAYLHRSDDFLRFAAHVMIVEMMAIHGAPLETDYYFRYWNWK